MNADPKMTTNNRHRIAQIVVVAMGAVVLTIGLLMQVRDVTRVANWTQSGFVLCSARQLDSATVIFL